jgi:CheY-like chemotaxis protein
MKSDGPTAREALRKMHESLISLKRVPHVLIVDDSHSDCILLQHDLLAVDPTMVVDFSHSSSEASVACAKKKYDVIFLDLMFPQNTGAKMLSEPWAQNSHLIVITGADPGSIPVEQAVKAGAKVIFTKPISRKEISLVFGRDP